MQTLLSAYPHAHIELLSFHYNILTQAKRAMPHYPTIYNIYSLNKTPTELEHALTQAVQGNLDGIDLEATNITQALVRLAHQNNTLINAWIHPISPTPDSLTTADHLHNLGVDTYISNIPPCLQAALQSCNN